MTNLAPMDGAWVLRRARWRRRGAWLWPAFIVLVVADGVVGHLLPLTGTSQSWAAGAVAGLCLNVVGVILLSWPLAMLIRRVRPDLPDVVARNYAGTAVVVAVFVGLTSAGLVHHQTVTADRSAMREAVARAQAWIGDRAPAQFRRNLTMVDAFPIEAGSVYRSCVPSLGHGPAGTYCVIVDLNAPFGQSVRFAGSEPNSLFSQGVG